MAVGIRRTLPAALGLLTPDRRSACVPLTPLTLPIPELPHLGGDSGLPGLGETVGSVWIKASPSDSGGQHVWVLPAPGHW